MATESPTSLNAQDFSGSDDEILDNFAEGPDDGTPMGLGGEKGKQSEPASSTLESDIVNGIQPGEEPETSAGEPEPVQEPAGETGEEKSPEPDSEEPKTPEFPQALLQMAGLADAESAQSAGFQTPEALFAAIKWRSQLLAPGTQTAQPSQQSWDGLYRRTQQQVPEPTKQVTQEKTSETKPFQLPAEKLELLDEDLQDVIRQMNDHYQQEVESLRVSVSQRDADLVRQQEVNEAEEFDRAVQKLSGWEEVFGEGSGMDLARVGQSNPAAMTNINHRAMLFETVETIREINAKQGYKPMTLEQEIQWALMQRYPDKFQQTISVGSPNGNGQRRNVTASRPTQRNTPPKSHNAKVLADVNSMLKKRRGYTLDMGHEEEFEGEI